MFNTGKPLVSIIIPVYNTENFVGRAIDSVLAQTYENIEIILVNDGSTDTSVEVCERYVQKHNNIKLIYQKNSGVSVARNTGLQAAKGEYIQFLDSDDEIENEMTENFVDLMVEKSYDIVICGYSTIGKVNNVITNETRCYESKNFLFTAYLDAKLLSLISSSWNMIFKKKLLEENNIRFNSIYAIGEDGLFTLDYLTKCKKVYVLNKVLYNYYIYEPKERISAVSRFVPDVYELRCEYFRRLFSELNHFVDDQQRIRLLQVFHDRLISGLVRLGAYFEQYSKKDIENRIASILYDDLVNKSGKVYKRGRKGDSFLIPFLIKFKLKSFLIIALRKHGRKYIRKYGKRSIIGTIYKKTI